MSYLAFHSIRRSRVSLVVSIGVSFNLSLERCIRYFDGCSIRCFVRHFSRSAFRWIGNPVGSSFNRLAFGSVSVSAGNSAQKRANRQRGGGLYRTQRRRQKENGTPLIHEDISNINTDSNTSAGHCCGRQLALTATTTDTQQTQASHFVDKRAKYHSRTFAFCNYTSRT